MSAPRLPALLTKATRLLPVQPLELAVSRLIVTVAQRHPGLFDRLGEHASKSIAVVPADLPVVFLLRPDSQSPTVEVHAADAEPTADARVSGPLLALVDLAEGRLDGDALFFSGDIRIEGDVEAVVALRNALDGEGLDLMREFVSPLGPFAAGAERVGKG